MVQRMESGSRKAGPRHGDRERAEHGANAVT
jgi:hypothetical protein